TYSARWFNTQAQRVKFVT
ncbi:glycine cleavage system P-family protein, partial [Vibrio parahaemolyticus V-223/04]